MIDFFKDIFSYRDEKKLLLYVLLVSFLGTFVVARSFSLYVGSSLYIRGYQIHHFYFGALILSIGGVMGMLSKHKKKLLAASIFIGIGIGLFADEIGLLLNCTTLSHQCVYAFPDALDIIGTISVVIVLVVMFVGFAEKKSRGKYTAVE